MAGSPLLVEFEPRKLRYTHLIAFICEEDGAFTIQVRLYDQARPEDAAWGEEIADSFETASELVAVLADEFSIQQSCIKIEVRMNKMTQGTRH